MAVVSFTASSNIISVLLMLVLYNVILCENNCKPKDCIDLKCYRVSTADDGPHTAYPNKPNLPNTMNISCNQIEPGGGWTIWMRRYATTNNTNFDHRTSEEFKNGFGRQDGPNSEFYLGNDLVHKITESYPSKNGELRIGGTAFDGTKTGISADKFRVGSEADRYVLRLETERDNVNVRPGTLTYHNGIEFKQGNDYCAPRYKQIPFWFNQCTKFFFFGPHGSGGNYPDGYRYVYIDAAPDYFLLKRAFMLIRPFGDSRSCNNPCLNGATCHYVPAGNTRRCICPQSHCGLTCERLNMCMNSGTCLYDATANKYSCKCPAEFTGETCKYRITAPVSTTTTTSTTTIDGATTGNVTYIIILLTCFVLVLLVVAAVIAVLLMRKKKKQQANEKELELLLAEKPEMDETDEEAGWLTYLGF